MVPNTQGMIETWTDPLELGTDPFELILLYGGRAHAHAGLGQRQLVVERGERDIPGQFDFSRHSRMDMPKRR